jgi:polyisoprenoid-binding protein YceI
MPMRKGDAKNYSQSSAHRLPALLIIGALTAASSAGAAPQTYRVDPAKSRATIHVGKAGAFSFLAGHSHVVAGPIESGSVDVDADAPSQARIQLVIASADLKVTPDGEPAGDAPKVQDAMESDKVLDVAHHPRITFESTSVTMNSRRGDALELAVTGRLTIRGTARPVTAPVRVQLSESALTASGKMTIKQTEFGIKPVSVGGVVAVKDALEIDFSIGAAK